VGGVRILFAGSPAIALPSLEAVADLATELAVISQPDKPVGRKKILTPTAVSSWAIDRDVTLYRPVDHNSIAQMVSAFAPDIGITVAYGRLLRYEVLAIPSSGWWNLHFSLLPRWRGAAPVQNALLAGDTNTGVTVFQLDEGLDTGPILSQQAHVITPGMTSGQLLEELSHVGATLLINTLQAHRDGHLTVTAQHGEPTHAPKLNREAGRIRSTDTVDMAYRRFQATTPEPGCFLSWSEGKHSLRVLSATAVPDTVTAADGIIRGAIDGVAIGLAGGVLLLHTVQPAGKTAMPATDWWRGIHREIRIDG
jgi:methionyl-tRNA formyltransferase